MARLVRVGEHLSVLPGCEVLGELGKAVDLILRSFQERITQEEFQFPADTCDQFYELGDDECFSDITQQAEISGGMPLQAFDLNGLLVLTELNLYLYSHLRLLSQGPDGSAAEMGLVPCALLPDYYLRTCGTELAQNCHRSAGKQRGSRTIMNLSVLSLHGRISPRGSHGIKNWTFSGLRNCLRTI